MKGKEEPPYARYFAGWKGSVIPRGALITVLKNLPVGRSIVEYQGRRYWVLTRRCWRRPPNV